MSTWTEDAARAALTKAGLAPTEGRPIEHGVQLVLPAGTLVNVYRTGRVNVQGKASPEREHVSKIFHQAAARVSKVPAVPVAASLEPLPVRREDKKKVFVVCGHDTEATKDLEVLLHRLKTVEPIILANKPATGKTIIEALIETSDVHYAIVLLTPDDEGHMRGKPDKIRPRARQNVVLELGMFLAKLGRPRVAILHKGDLELPSDIQGLIYIPFTAKVGEAKNKLAAALQEAGFYIDVATLTAE